MELLRIPEAAKMLAISRRAVYDLIAAGALTPYRPTAKKTVIRLLRSDVEAHIAASAQRTAVRAEERRRSTSGAQALELLERFGYRVPGAAGTN